jgi:hypothetical protein
MSSIQKLFFIGKRRHGLMAAFFAKEEIAIVNDAVV